MPIFFSSTSFNLCFSGLFHSNLSLEHLLLSYSLFFNFFPIISNFIYMLGFFHYLWSDMPAYEPYLLLIEQKT